MWVFTCSGMRELNGTGAQLRSERTTAALVEPIPHQRRACLGPRRPRTGSELRRSPALARRPGYLDPSAESSSVRVERVQGSVAPDSLQP